ncbi:unnamed protein product [Auanema sp. JU1783]|nr:unnamed protein product [Auanema sp. JU1783]
MSPGLSRLYELQPDPYDVSQKKPVRICLFTEVKNAPLLRVQLKEGKIDAAMIRAELILEPFILLAAANRAVHQMAHNRLSTRSLSAEMIYSLSPSRNISDSLVTFGIAENSENIVVCIFDDKDGSKMKSVAEKIEGKPQNLDLLPSIANMALIKRVYQINDLRYKEESISDHILTRLVTKDFTS